jgi:CubicO group peptidase (beta-lactamase class C family)
MFLNPFISFAIAAFAVTPGAGAEDVSGLLAPIRERHNVPALAAAAVRGNELIAIGATGVREQGALASATVDDKWHIGSCTKSMTASLAAMLVEQGKIKWETTVVDVFPQLREKMREQWRTVTLEQLLTHRGGAPSKAPEDLWTEARRSRGTSLEQRLAFVRGLLAREPEASPGTKFIYSNQGYAIAGAMLERVMGMPWEELLTTRLFAPLGLKSAGFGAPGVVTRLDQPRGHLTRGGKIQAVPPGPFADNPPAIGPAGTVHCAIGDLARYGAWHAQGARGARPLLTEQSFTKIHHPADGQEYAMGWGVTQREWAGGVTLTHAGSNTMWYAVMWVAPEKEAAFVAATNIAGPEAEKACDEAVAAIIKRVLKK